MNGRCAGAFHLLAYLTKPSMTDLGNVKHGTGMARSDTGLEME